MGIIKQLKNLIYRPFYFDPESKIIFSYLEHLNAKNLKILDVGCGVGRILKQLKEKGYNATGVEVNESIVSKNKAEGLNCLTVSEFKNSSQIFDVILMCHIIEHFMPQDLLNFMDSYLDKLAIGGKLIISTPLMTSYFYNDFDHIKPYSPMGLSMVFGGSADQVQYYSKNKIQLVNIKFRKSFFRFSNIRSQYVFTWYKPIVRLLELMSAYAALLTCGLIAKRDGWIGVYQKVK